MPFKYRLHENITILSSLAHVFFNYTTTKKVTDLHDAELDKRQRNKLQRLDDPPEYSSKNSSWNVQMSSVRTNRDFKSRISPSDEPSSSFLFDKSQFRLTEPENIITLPSTYLHNTEVSTAYSSLNINQITSSFVKQLFDPTPQTFI